ncbi:ROK family protein [Kineococcus sp. SYSU DK003]|uniref:ROK family protein n=1 Tax=Kineococcus sp. SYSU DK003 TaxID=3383124 RepID=UPI003D7D0CC0
MSSAYPREVWKQIETLLTLVRSGRAQTRPELVDETGLGRNVVAERLSTIAALGLLRPEDEARSRGGRAARVLRLDPTAGHVLVGLIGIQRLHAAVCDLDGTVLARRDVDWHVSQGAQETCTEMARLLRALAADEGVRDVWGATVGLPSSVDPGSGLLVDPVPSTSPGRWPADFAVQDFCAGLLDVPVWVESAANLGALGAARSLQVQDLLWVRVGSGVTAALVSGGRLHRGGNSMAGALAHVALSSDQDRICLCGRSGCLEAYVGGWALLDEAQRAAAVGSSRHLAAVAARRPVTLEDLAAASAAGDPASVQIVVRAGNALGRMLSYAAALFDPSAIVITGNPVIDDQRFEAALQRALQTNLLPALADGITLRAGAPGGADALAGGAELAVRSLLSAPHLAVWAESGAPRALAGARLSAAV